MYMYLQNSGEKKEWQLGLFEEKQFHIFNNDDQVIICSELLVYRFCTLLLGLFVSTLQNFHNDIKIVCTFIFDTHGLYPFPNPY